VVFSVGSAAMAGEIRTTLMPAMAIGLIFILCCLVVRTLWSLKRQSPRYNSGVDV
jgi:hypothetical protein